MAGTMGSMIPRSGGTGGGMVWSGRVSPAPDGIASEAPVPAQFFKNFARAAGDGEYSFANAFGTALADLELAPVNEKLGSYFGVSEGVLVIDVPAKGSLGLAPGDVVTAVDGRKVSNPGQLMRILGTYEKNEEFKLQIMRQKRTETVTAKLP
jgi:S1-C subfamily serine protease